MQWGQLDLAAKPSKVIVVQPDAFCDDWAQKPRTEVAVGLKRLSQKDLEEARMEAEREAMGFYDLNSLEAVPTESLVDIYNDALLCSALSRATTDPNNSRIPFFGDMANETIRMALTSEGLKSIWDELVLLTKITGTGTQAISDEGIKKLVKILTGKSAESCPQEVKKALQFCLEQLDTQSEDEYSFLGT